MTNVTNTYTHNTMQLDICYVLYLHTLDAQQWKLLKNEATRYKVLCNAAYIHLFTRKLK